MTGKSQRKLFQKRITSRQSVDGIKQVDGRDKQIADVRGGNLDDNAINRRVINQGAVGFDEIGIREVGGNRIYDDGVTRAHISGSAVGTAEVANDAITPGKLDREYANKSHSHDFPSRTGSSDGSVGDHSHSISSTTFIKQPIEVRMRMLNDRLDLMELIDRAVLGRVLSVIARNILNILILLMDYREMNAYQRERAFEDPALSGWADVYKRVYGVDEYAEEDRSNFLRYGDVRMDPYTGIAPSEGSSQSAEDLNN